MNVNLVYITKNIIIILKNIDFAISHVPLDGNVCVDLLAKKGSKISSCEVFINSNRFHELKGMIRMDKLGFLYISK